MTQKLLSEKIINANLPHPKFMNSSTCKNRLWFLGYLPFIKEYQTFFKDIKLRMIAKIKPEKKELQKNPRSRSAILRIGEVEYVS